LLKKENMKKLLLILCIVITSLTQAQSINIYESSLSEGYLYNYDTEKYELKEEVWEKTKFAYTKEWLAIELKPDNVTKVWWAYHNTITEGIDCYYIEGDVWKVCVNTRDNELWLYRGEKDGKFEYLLSLSKIEKVNTIE